MVTSESIQEGLTFSDSLKDLKNLRTQLYSAAEYFELSYINDDQKQIVVNTIKDYAIKALVSTVDHLGSVTFKVNNILCEKVDEFSGTALGVSCIEQRIRSCQQHIDHAGFSQQSLVINTPKYQKRYILPVGEAIGTKPKYHGCSLAEGYEWQHFRQTVRATTIRENPSSTVRKGRSPSPRPLQRASSFLFNNSTQRKDFDKPDKRTVSPHRFPLIRSGSLSSRPTTPNSRSTTPNPIRTNAFNVLQRFPSVPRTSALMCIRPEQVIESVKEVEQQPSKNKHILKSFLSRRKSKKDDTLYTYLD